MGQIYTCAKPSATISKLIVDPVPIKIFEQELQSDEIFITNLNLGDFSIMKVK